MKHALALLGALVAFVWLAPPVLSQGPGPKKVLQVLREEIKPARAAAHIRAEEAYVKAFRGAKAPVYYLGLRTLSGGNEAWFVSSYDSYAAWEKENDMIGGNAALVKQLEQADDQDAAFRTGQRSLVLELVEELSYRPRPTAQDFRYLTVVTTRIRPGHGRDFEEARKAFTAAHEKANVDEHWAFYRVAEGMPGPAYMIIMGGKSMAEADHDPHTQAFRDAVGDEGRKMMQQVQRDSVLFNEVVTLEIVPRMSNVPDEWIKARPDFWKAPAMPTTSAAPRRATEPAVKPAAQQ
jgi:hypothetical protein